MTAATGTNTAAPPVTASSGPAKPPGQRLFNATRVTLLALVLPSVVVLVLINAYPLAYAAFQSVHNGTLISTGSYVGL